MPKSNGCVPKNGVPRRVAYTKKSVNRKSEIILGIDPGLANTGVVVMKKYPSGKIEILFSKTIRTKPENNLRERVDKIAKEVVRIGKAHKCSVVICEAFEVRGWQKPQMSAQSMSKLINAIALRSLEARLYFGLSSPDMKKRTEWFDVVDDMGIKGAEKVKSCHAKDAGLHAALYLRGDLLEKLGIN